jgi:hypothetical protein
MKVSRLPSGLLSVIGTLTSIENLRFRPRYTRCSGQVRNTYESSIHTKSYCGILQPL